MARTQPLAAAIRRVCRDLDATGLRYALVGGLAVSARAEPRLTRDIDLAVAVQNDAGAETILHGLSGRGYRIVTVVEHTRMKRLSTARLSPKGGRVIVDLLFASCGIEAEIVEAAELLEILPGVTIPVARTEHLIAMKLLARDDRQRPQDLDDIRSLLAIADATQRRLVTAAIGKIVERGFSRGRDLRASWRAVSRSTSRRPGRAR